MARLLALAIFALSLYLPSAEACERHGTFSCKIDVGGMQRHYRLHIPRSYRGSQSMPLVIVLHGALSSGKFTELNSGMTRQSEKDGFLVAYPEGYFHTWNAGACCAFARRKKVDDVEFIKKLIGQVKQIKNVDVDRVYVAGVSNGAMLAYRVARELSSDIAGIATVAGCMYTSSSCDPVQPVSVIVFHGTADKVIPYNGGIGHILGHKVKANAVKDAVQYWKHRDGCGERTTERISENVELISYCGGTQGSDVCLYTIRTGGHTWPGGLQAKLICDRASQRVSATQIMCQFFLAHPRQSR